MTNIAIKFWKENSDKHPNMPDEWPWHCKEIGEDTSYKDDSGEWLVMSFDDYHKYVEEKQPLYDKYKAALPVVDPLPTEIELVKADLEAVKIQLAEVIGAKK